MKSKTESDLAQAALDYERDGAACLRQVVSPDLVRELGDVVDALMADGVHGFDAVPDRSRGRFYGDVFSTLHQPVLKAFVSRSGLAEIVGKIMKSAEVRFFYDQVLVKEPGTSARTAWHQDLPYWPVTGEQVISTWVPIDAATPESGVVTYVKGSHRWAKFFPMQPFSEDPGAAVNQPNPGSKPDLDKSALGSNAKPVYDDADGPGKHTLADVRAHPEHYEFATWDVEPGDVIIHHPLAVHGAPGNLSQARRRRAVAYRWLGDDARWDDSRPHFMRGLKNLPGFPYPALSQGAKLDAPLFPVAWTR